VSVRNLSRGWIGLVAALFLAPAAGALNITPLTPALGGTNTTNFTDDATPNRSQTTSTLTTMQAPIAAPDTLNSYSEFITRYAMMVAADRTPNGGSSPANMTSSYSITFTVDNPTGASLRIDIDTLRAGALTSVADTGGNSTITLGAITGQCSGSAITGPCDGGTEAGLGAPLVSQNSTGSANTPVSQAGTTLSILTNAVTSTYVLQFDWTSSVESSQQGAAIRMGDTASISSTTADDYPGVDSRTQADDGHKVTVRATIISTPEPAPAALIGLGLVGLAIRARRAGRRAD